MQDAMGGWPIIGFISRNSIDEASSEPRSLTRIGAESHLFRPFARPSTLFWVCPSLVGLYGPGTLLFFRCRKRGESSLIAKRMWPAKIDHSGKVIQPHAAMRLILCRRELCLGWDTVTPLCCACPGWIWKQAPGKTSVKPEICFANPTSFNRGLLATYEYPLWWTLCFRAYTRMCCINPNQQSEQTFLTC